MFKRKVSQDEFDLLARAVDNLREKYWELYHDHHLLLDHLGLTEREQPKKKELVSTLVNKDIHKGSTKEAAC